MQEEHGAPNCDKRRKIPRFQGFQFLVMSRFLFPEATIQFCIFRRKCKNNIFFYSNYSRTGKVHSYQTARYSLFFSGQECAIVLLIKYAINLRNAAIFHLLIQKYASLAISCLRFFCRIFDFLEYFTDKERAAKATFLKTHNFLLTWIFQLPKNNVYSSIFGNKKLAEKLVINFSDKSFTFLGTFGVQDESLKSHETNVLN